MDLDQRIASARKESRQLISHISRAKQSARDTVLPQAAASHTTALSSVNMRSYRTLTGHFNKVLASSWFPDSQHLVSGSQDGFMIVWDTRSRRKLNAIRLYDPWITSCAVSPDGRFIATGDLENACIVYKACLRPPYRHEEMLGTQQEIKQVFKGHTEYVSGVKFLDSTKLTSSSGDRTCLLWDLASGKRLQVFHGHLGDVLAIDTAGPQFFVSCGSDKMANLWDIRTRYAARQYPLAEHYDASAIRFFPDNASFAVGSDDGVVRLLDLRTDGEIARYALPERRFPADSAQTDTLGVLSMDFSASGRLMFVSYADCGVKTWDVLRGSVMGALIGHSKPVSVVETSPDGTAVATASYDTTLKIWAT